MNGKYDDIIHLQRPVSTRHPPMPMAERAGQFSPFAALVGHEAAIREMGRLTQQRVELDESRKQELNEKLRLLCADADQTPSVTITWFRPDDRKKGGSYLDTTGMIRKIDAISHEILLDDGTRIPVEQVYEITSAEEELDETLNF